MSGKAFKLTVHQNQRYLAVQHGLQNAGVHMGGGNHQQIHAPVQQMLQLVRLHRRLVQRGRHHQMVPLGPQHAGHVFGDLGKERMHQVRHHEAHRVATASG